jgi:N-acetylmuramoyl-L-alanine amidase
MHIILDNGHGGIIKGVYQTAGKRSPKWKDGRQLFEGEFNRVVVNELASMCQTHNIPFTVLVPELKDISLAERVLRANNIYKEKRDSILISVHANAGGGTGFEAFTTKGETKSDAIAEVLIKQFVATIPELRLRKDTTDGDLDKEAQFKIIRETYCPAVLLECAFMDTYEPDCRMMLDNPDLFVSAIFNGFLNLKEKL